MPVGETELHNKTTINAEGHSPAGELVILGTVFLDMVAISLITPVFPKLIMSISGYGVAEVAGIFASFTAVFGITQFIGAPILGAASDHFGRRPVIVFSNIVSGLQFALMALAPNLAWLFIGRVISGFATASMPAANAWVADVVPPHRRAARFALVSAAMSLGFFIGPGIGGFLGSSDPRAPFWAAAVLCLLNGAFGYFVLRESLPLAARVAFRLKHSIPIGSMIHLVRNNRILLSMFPVSIFYFFAQYAMITVGVLYTTERYGWDSDKNGLMFMAVGGCNMFVQLVLLKPLINLLGQRRSLMLGIACQMIALCIYGLAFREELFWIGIPIWSFGSLVLPIWNSLLTQSVNPTEQGKLSGVTSSLMSLMSILAPFIYAGVFASSITRSANPALAGAPFFLAAASQLAGIVTVWSITRAGSPLAATLSHPFQRKPAPATSEAAD